MDKQEFNFASICSGSQSLLQWIREHIDQNGSLTESLPDHESINLFMPELENMRFIDGMLDGNVGGNEEECAQEVFNMLLCFAKDSEQKELDSAEMNIHLSKIYTYVITHMTETYVDILFSMLMDSFQTQSKSFVKVCLDTAELFIKHAAHREALKLGIIIRGSFDLDDETLDIYRILGVSDELASYVGFVLQFHKYNDIIFELARKVKGWGKTIYVEYLNVENEAMREWLLFEGYECDSESELLPCMQKGDLLGYIQDKGFDDRLYDATGKIIHYFNFGAYADSKEVVKLFMHDSLHRKMNLERFSILCDFKFFLDFGTPQFNRITFSDTEREELLGIIHKIAFESQIESLVKSNPLDPYAYKIALSIEIDTWEEVFAIAQKDKYFDDWRHLMIDRHRHNEERCKRLCALMVERYDSLKQEPKDELGMGAELKSHSDSECVVQSLNRFCDEIDRIEMIETLLKSPVPYNRSLALRMVKHWQEHLEIPQSTLEILIKMFPKTYEQILNTTNQAIQKLHLQVWADTGGSGIWGLNKDNHFESVDYDTLGLTQELQRDFRKWQEIFEIYMQDWHKDSSRITKRFKKAFFEEGLELARQLKGELKNRAYVEYSIYNNLQEIKYYYWKHGQWYDECDRALQFRDITNALGLELEKESIWELTRRLNESLIPCCIEIETKE